MTHPAGSCWLRRCCRQNLQHLLRFATCGIPQHKNWSLVGVNTCPWLKFKTQTYLNHTNQLSPVLNMTSTTKCDVTNNKVHSKVLAKRMDEQNLESCLTLNPLALPTWRCWSFLQGCLHRKMSIHLVHLSRNLTFPGSKSSNVTIIPTVFFGFVCNSVAISLGPQFLSTS